MSLKEKLKVMVVDDMSTSRGLITQALDEIGIVNYATSNDGNSALKALQAAPVHLVLSDYNMPGANGLDLLQGLRKTPATQRIGFILITGKATPDIIQRGQTLGMNNFIKKPFSVPEIKGCIEQVVGKL
ncbi:response regulator receiver protein [Poseidonocella pacifica]|uniref:Response regulator receiver protein n=1 Tax=Poseidonocella pacifica TaxID=871651 RepID=A0A1I0VFU5_9RHOB|nr:response regulator [Poseidonocella pacifica]SFA74850.1 response regulator receiver protein [Poseidonocella pacifica]